STYRCYLLKYQDLNAILATRVFTAVRSRMWRYIFFYISICLFVSETLTLNVEKSSHDRNLRHVNEGKKCEDGDKNEGVCKDDRDIDFDDYGFEKGCYHPDKPCWLFNYCEGHMHCYIIFEKEDGTRLDEACLSIGGHCVKPGTRFDGILRKNLCPCDYDCYLQVADELCVSPNHCQHIDAPCGGTKNSALCDGEDFVCCVSHTNDGKCTNEPPTGVKGTCKDNTEECDGWYVTDRCSGPAGRQCCVPSGNDVDCTSIPNAQCMDIRKEPCENEEGEEGDYRSGLCSGPAYRQCCILGCPDHYKGLNNEDISTDCHLNYGCCRPFCIDGEIQIDFSCQTKDRDGNLITSNCVCCKGDRPVSAKPGGGGDPHYKTLDSHTYTFDGHCSYILMRECSNYLGTPRFTVIAKHD
uniref:Kielin/chordin-like protein-like n=1 Tax=Saccoglossus kowalevskii TaxID=10224 RepID=A0ABM0LYR0_SACKO